MSKQKGPLPFYSKKNKIRSGFCGFSSYFAPLVCMLDVVGVLAVWRHNKPKTQKQNPGVGGGLIKKWVSDRVNVGMVDLGHVGGGLD